jgi:predicted outer membrane repeat protein
MRARLRHAVAAALVLAGAAAGAAATAATTGLPPCGDGNRIVNSGSAKYSDCTVSGHVSASAGGGVWNAGTLELDNVVVSDNTAAGDNGGGIYNNYGATLILKNVKITGNKALCSCTALGYGGGIWNGGVVKPTNVTISGNRASQNGGGIWNEHLVCCVSQDVEAAPRIQIKNNKANAFGGGIYNDGGYVAFAIFAISGNRAQAQFGGGGGGIFDDQGTVSLERGSITGNISYDGGGGAEIRGFFCCSSHSNYNKNLTISGNTATDGGGGLYLVGTAYLLNATIADNSAPAGRGNDLDSEDGGLLIANSIVADATPGGECAGFVTFSNGHNLDAGTSCNFHNTGDISNGNADLGPLQHNPPGPSYVLTRALGPQSEAIDAADDALAPAKDARGVERPQGPHSDIGAYELVP